MISWRWMWLSFLTLSLPENIQSTDPSASSSEAEKQILQPTFTTGLIEQKAVTAKRAMVATSTKYASEAAVDILCRGGSALDAAIAAQAMLTLTEPEASGIGGGAFLLYYDSKTKTVYAYDGRETAPKSLNERSYLDKEGKALNFFDVLTGGMSVGVPGVLKMLDMAHKNHGKLAWKELFTKTIEQAEKGFPASDRLVKQLTASDRINVFNETTDIYFLPDRKTPISAGSIIKNPKLAKTLRLIAEKGVEVFYEGEIARDIISAIRNSKVNPGVMTLDDLKNYHAKQRQPLTIDYRNFKVYSTPPPSGGVVVLQLLSILNNFDLSKMSPLSPEFIHLYAEASKLAYADRGRCLADPDFISVPIDKMLDPIYTAARAKLINSQKSMGIAQPGITGPCPLDKDPDHPSTTHMTIVDKEGNAVSMSSSVERIFGSGITVDGFILNNQMTDFNFLPEMDGEKVANRIQPFKRPRSAMSPVMVFDRASGRLVLVIGSPGGSRIIEYISRTMVDIMDFNMNVQTAISSPNFTDQNSFLELEKGTAIENLKPALEKLGHEVKIVDINSGIHAIAITPDGLVGGADPRREGRALSADECLNPRDGS